ncbi:transcription factor ssl1 [Nitzschia inconspicua]|uniref:General transcription factor IIH subunit n=1 Tax=Nitzschia inconspicua TaxID=303405 RepID=A0A9K3LBK5_9STRA|nr:transcription factor ssl1 [Nitzschia inconspicua]KAG7359435.1 transcription factor ssl1 [Nitzschia inconspicua]
MSSALSTSAAPAASNAPSSHVWEEATNTWESAVQEDAEGNIIVAGQESVANLIRHRRKRLEQNDYAQRNRRVVRDMIRYMYVLIDGSQWMRSKDPVLPGGTKLEVTVQLLHQFVQEYYDQNPLSHLGFVILKNGEAEVLTKLSSSSKTHKLALQTFLQESLQEGPSRGGVFSLQNGLEVAGRSLGHQPRHGSREILILCAALSTCDPGHILTETMPRLKAANIRVSTFALAAELHICRKLSEETGGAMGVCLDKGHMRDWMLEQCVPPPALRREWMEHGCEMVQMGFPTRTKSDIPVLVHATKDTKLITRTSYTCPQCLAKIQELPADCVVCGLKLVLSPHLARTFHHLFPVAPFSEYIPPPTASIDDGTNKDSNNPQTTSSAVAAVSAPPALAALSSSTAKSAAKQQQKKRLDSKLRLAAPNDDRNSCFACLRMVGIPNNEDGGDAGEEELRFCCPECRNIFCVNCDSYLHETLHNCPGCLLKDTS